MNKSRRTVVDLFSGAGGMSAGFHRHNAFTIVAAVDAERGKPSSRDGSLQCNNTYADNIGIQPLNLDLENLSPAELNEILQLERPLNVLSVCPPCTGFSRTNPQNHLRDDPRNGLVAKSAEFAVTLDPSIVVMENARELIRGNFRHHYLRFREVLEANGYDVRGDLYFLNRLGLPQIRERAVVVAVKRPLVVRSLDDLWSGYSVGTDATTVRRAFAAIEATDDHAQVFPDFGSEVVRQRIENIPVDGGSWIDLVTSKNRPDLLTPAMKRIYESGRIGSYPDVYGRMRWDRPAPTIKRECSHVGNGRYVHPDQNRMCSIREMAVLQGFPTDYKFRGSAMSNLYRHIGDAVPPLISYQLAHLCHWILTDTRPEIESILLEMTHLRADDIVGTNGRVQSDHIISEAV